MPNRIISVISSADSRKRMDSSTSGWATSMATLENRTLKPQMICPRAAMASGIQGRPFNGVCSMGQYPSSNCVLIIMRDRGVVKYNLSCYPIEQIQ